MLVLASRRLACLSLVWRARSFRTLMENLYRDWESFCSSLFWVLRSQLGGFGT